MKLVIATLGALTLLSAGAASAATATYSFEGATDGDVSLASALAPLGVTSSSIASATGGLIGVFSNGGNQPNATFGAKSFAIGNNGAWSLVFGPGANGGTINGVNSVSFIYNETEVNGFTAAVFNQAGTQLGSTQIIVGGGANSIGTVTFSGLGVIGRLVVTDTGNDNVQVDVLTVDTNPQLLAAPEPSTYMMIGSALAGLALVRRRRV